jgi:hypothetical protein
VEGESWTALALITDSGTAFQTSWPAVSVTGTNGLLRYLLETMRMGGRTVQRSGARMGRKSLQDSTTSETSAKINACELSDAIAGPFAGGQKHVEDNRIVDRDLMRPKSFTRSIGS